MTAAVLAALLVGGGVELPKTTDFTLPNGMRVFLIQNEEVPLVSFEARLVAGSMHDPDGKAGVARLLSNLLTKGAGARNRPAFLEAIEFGGGTFVTNATQRWLTVKGEFISEHGDLAMELLADALRRPTLDAKQFAKERSIAIDRVRAARQRPRDLIQTYWTGWFFRGHAYARPPSGDEKTLDAITLGDIKAARAKLLRPEHTWLAVSGSFGPAEMRKRIEKMFGDWASGEKPLAHRARVTAAKAGRVLLVDKPNALQTYFRLGGPGFDRSDPDYPARYLANTILGGRFTSRLNTALRIKGGLTYRVGSRFDDSLGGAFHIESFTQTMTSERAIKLALSVYEKFAKEGMTQAELDSARDYVKGQYALETVETAEQAAAMILSLESNGLLRDIVDRFFERLDALTLVEVNRVIRERFPKDNLSWVVIGQANLLEPIVRSYGKVTRVKIDGPGFAPR